MDFSKTSQQGGRRRKVSYLGHTPRGTATVSVYAGGGRPLTQNKSLQAADDYRTREKSSSVSLSKEVFNPTEAHREKRLRQVRRRQLKQARFNLNGEAEDEESFITHRGQPLSHIADAELAKDDFDDEDLLRDSDDEESKRWSRLLFTFLAAKQMSHEATELNFGGEGDSGEPAKKKPRMEIYREVMAKSKKHKAESQRDKAMQRLLLGDLDSAFSSLRETLTFKPVKNTSDAVKFEEEERVQDMLRDRRSKNEKANEESFDKVLNSLKLEAQGHATDRVKTKAEIIAEKARKLREIEAERLRRIKQAAKEDANAAEEDDHPKSDKSDQSDSTDDEADDDESSVASDDDSVSAKSARDESDDEAAGEDDSCDSE